MKWTWRTENAGWKANWDRYKYILLVILTGVLLLLPSGHSEKKSQITARQQEEELFDLEGMEKKLERALSQIQGAGAVSVVLTLKESGLQVVARDTEVSDTEQRSTAVIVSNGSGVQQTVPLQSIYPKYQGALVVCTGGGDAKVKLELMRAVSALTGLSADKISICKGQ